MLHSSVGLARGNPEPLPALGRRRSQLSVVGHPDTLARVFGDWQLAADAARFRFLLQ